MTDDLLKRLRKHVIHLDAWGKEAIPDADLVEEAADRIKKLEAALREIIGALNDPKGGQHVYDMRNASYIARKALEGKDD